MSLKAQEVAYKRIHVIIYASLAVGLPLGFLLQMFRVTVFIVLGASALAAVLYGPNWGSQGTENDVQWVERDKTKAYYDALKNARNAETEEDKKRK